MSILQSPFSARGRYYNNRWVSLMGQAHLINTVLGSSDSYKSNNLRCEWGSLPCPVINKITSNSGNEANYSSYLYTMWICDQLSWDFLSIFSHQFFFSLGTGHKRNVFRGKTFADPTIKKSKYYFTHPQISLNKK